VQKKTNDTCFYNHNLAHSTWIHDELVQKNPYPTTQQAQKSVVTTKSNRHPLQSWGILKPFPPHKEQNNSTLNKGVVGKTTKKMDESGSKIKTKK
jgi:hypothetical protein